MTLRKTFALASLLLGLLLSMLPAWAAEEGGTDSPASFRVGLRGPTPPFIMYGENGSLTGMAVEIFEEAGRRIGRSVQSGLISDVERNDEFLMRGEFDIALIASRRAVDPSLIKYPASSSIFYQLYVHKDFDTVLSVLELDDLVVGYSSPGTRDFVLKSSKPRQTIGFASVLEGMLELDRKHIHAFMAFDRDIGEFVVRDLGLRNVVTVGPAFEEVPMSVVGRKEDIALVESVSRALREMKEDGTMRRISGRWIRLEGQSKIWKRYGRWGLLGAVAVVLGTLGVVFWNQQLHRMVKSVTADLQLSEQRYRVLLESAPFMALLVSSDGHIHLANAVAVQELGLPAADHPGNLFDHVLDTDRPSLLGILHDASVVRTPSSVNLTFLRPGQDAVEVEIVAVERPVTNDSVLTCCFLRNVTQEKTMQRALQEQDRLAIVGAMAAGFAHEINNPLAIIQANVDNLQTLDLPEEERQGLMAMSRSLERMGSLSQRLLLLSKAGEMKVTGIDLNDVVEDCLQLMRHKLKGVEVRTDLARGGAWMHGDAHLVSHVLLNLLLNAHEALSSASVRVPVILVRTCVTPDGTSLCVADNGPGIPKENLLRIFDLFFTSGKPTGVGLGLYLCQRIVRSHGGLIFAQSSPGSGTMISLEFPDIPPLQS
jgi:signal transduction histidine kinase